MVVVVLPAPPSWLHSEMTRACVGPATGRGSENTGIGRPVGPISGSATWVAAGRSNGMAWLTGDSSSVAGGGGGAWTWGIWTVGGIAEALLPEPPENVPLMCAPLRAAMTSPKCRLHDILADVR